MAVTNNRKEGLMAQSRNRTRTPQSPAVEPHPLAQEFPEFQDAPDTLDSLASMRALYTGTTAGRKSSLRKDWEKDLGKEMVARIIGASSTASLSAEVAQGRSLSAGIKASLAA